ncbi:MAG: hypothetical protein CMH64_00605 [Nanoarchaeota archaeon]|nr:hypothetical protein [Nanoarchaeota archaeon]|tara:strand:+ start:1587 stop:1826 length:240 start_codon:yes stop_codon:yes gene_type:complete
MKLRNVVLGVGLTLGTLGFFTQDSFASKIRDVEHEIKYHDMDNLDDHLKELKEKKGLTYVAQGVGALMALGSLYRRRIQ